ncbi:hypothetical protein AMJ85_09100 [candidate division BRC1 bacterium SM23_51]|nr:MAG: hypothetical protein AMJ85_09100 [candidate division BRC1 bacterium SM23_51]
MKINSKQQPWGARRGAARSGEISVFRLATVLALSLVLGIAYNAVSNYPLPLWDQRDDSADRAFGLAGISQDDGTRRLSGRDFEAPTQGFSYAGLEEVLAWHEAGEVILVDGREPDEFEKGHLPTALNLPAASFRTGRPELLDYLPETERYVVYCSDLEHCGTAELVAEQLIIYGYKNVAVFREGFEGWKDAGLPLQSTAGENSQ